MNLDAKFTQLALKIRNLVVVDVSFPKSPFAEFKKLYEQRYIYMPCKKEMVMGFACGIASMGKLVVIYGADLAMEKMLDPTLNVKLLKESSAGSLESLENELKEFGPAVLLIPPVL
ncbi:MAG: hypothetical protein WC897_04745 [Candidatus Gracilibacteria bacterium]